MFRVLPVALSIPSRRAATAFALACLAAAAAGAGESPRQRERRQQADALVASILGGRSLDADIAKVRFLGEERYVASELARRAHEVSDPRGRQGLSLALGAFGGPESIQLLRDLSRDEDPVVRVNGLAGLGRLRAAGVLELAAALKDGSMAVRIA